MLWYLMLLNNSFSVTVDSSLPRSTSARYLLSADIQVSLILLAYATSHAFEPTLS